MSFTTSEDNPVPFSQPASDEPAASAGEGLLRVKPRLVTSRNRIVRERRHAKAENHHILDLTVKVCVAKRA